MVLHVAELQCMKSGHVNNQESAIVFKRSPKLFDIVFTYLLISVLCYICFFFCCICIYISGFIQSYKCVDREFI